MAKAPFNSYGVTLRLPDGDQILNAGDNMTIFPSGNLITFAAQIPKGVTSINGLRGDINFEAGDGITIGITGNTIKIQTGNGYVAESGFNLYVTEDGTGNYVTES